MFAKKPVDDRYADRKCKACMFKGEDRPCPCWVDAVEGMTEQNAVTGEQRLITGCFYQVIPQLMVHCVKATHRPQAAMEACRNEVNTLRKDLADVMQPIVQAVLTGPTGVRPMKEIGYEDGE